MAVRFYQLVIDARDPAFLARWRAAGLGQDILSESLSEVIVGAAPDRHQGLCFVPAGDARRGKNRLHIDLDPEGNEFCLTPQPSLVE